MFAGPAKRAVQECEVDGRLPSTAGDIELCLQAVTLDDLRRRMLTSWRNQLARVGGPDLGAAIPEDVLGRALEDLGRALSLAADVGATAYRPGRCRDQQPCRGGRGRPRPALRRLHPGLRPDPAPGHNPLDPRHSWTGSGPAPSPRPRRRCGSCSQTRSPARICTSGTACATSSRICTKSPQPPSTCASCGSGCRPPPRSGPPASSPTRRRPGTPLTSPAPGSGGSWTPGSAPRSPGRLRRSSRPAWRSYPTNGGASSPSSSASARGAAWPTISGTGSGRHSTATCAP